MNFSALECLVVDALLRRVRVLAFDQIEQLASGLGCEQSPRNAIRKLERHGLVQSFTAEVVLLSLESPLATWAPGEETPNFGKLAWLAKSRFLNAHPKQQRVTIATERAESSLGGVGGSLRQPNQLMHDLGTSSIFVTSHPKATSEFPEWIGEDFLRRRYRHLGLRKIPDAAIVVEQRLAAAVEFAGRDYSKAYLKRFHAYWEHKKTFYEIW